MLIKYYGKYMRKIIKKYYNNLSQKETKKQIAMIQKSRRLYKKGEYFSRKKLKKCMVSKLYQVKNSHKKLDAL
jgi:hypothetical protein